MISRFSLRSRALPIAVLVGAVVLVYWHSLGNAFVIWDDDTLVYANPLTQEWSWKNIAGAFTSYDPELYIPLTILSFQIEHAAAGFAPFLYHLDNLILHMLNAMLVFLLLEKLGLRRTTAFIAAMIFAVHPINTEAVAWVSARKDLLVASFSLTTLLAYLQWKAENSYPWFWIAFGCFVCALLSKPVAIVMPVILLLLDWNQHGRLTKRDFTSKIPWIAISTGFLIIGLYGKRNNIDALTLIETLLLACKSTLFSLGKFFWPSDLSIIYLQTDPVSIALPQFWVPVSVMIMIALAMTFFWWRMRRTRFVKILLIGCTWYGVFLLPSFSNFAKDDVYFFSDRYIYLAQLGILLMIGLAIDHVMTRANSRTRSITLSVICIPLLLLLGTSASARSTIWHDSETLYRDALSKNDRSVVMHYNLAVLAHRRDNLDEAHSEYEKALSLNPRYNKALNNLGVLYKQKGDIAKALEYLRLAIDANPEFPDPYSNIGSILMDQGDIDGAIVEFRKAIAVSDTFAQAHINLASALGRKGLYEEGLREYQRAFELAPQLLDDMPEVKKALENF